MGTLTPALAAVLALAWFSPQAQAAEETPQSLQKKCDAKDWEACVSLGDRYILGERGVAIDHSKAAALFERACNGNYGEACTGLALMYDGRTRPLDLNKELQLYVKACELKAGSGCYHFGKAFLKGKGVDKSLERGLNLLELACELKEGEACFDLFLMYDSGEEVAKDQARANAYYERSCDLYSTSCIMAFNEFLGPHTDSCELGDFRACYLVGSAHLEGESYLTPDEKGAAKFLQKACDGNVFAACGNLGWIYKNGKQIPKDIPKAIGYYQKACTGKDAYGCEQLGILYVLGDGVAKDARRAADLFRTACNMNVQDSAVSCGMLAMSYFEGLGVEKDPARAAILHAQACRLGYKESCSFKPEAGSTGPRAKPATANKPPAARTVAAAPATRAGEETVQSLQKKCDAKDWAACEALAYRYEDGDGVAKDLAKAVALFERGCNAGHGDSCTSLGLMYDGEMLPKDSAKVLRLLTRACDLKSNAGCQYLGLDYLDGTGVPQDVTRAVKFLDLACQLRNGDACVTLFAVYANGEHVPKDEKRGMEYYEKGCDLRATLCVTEFNKKFQPRVAKCDKGDGKACLDAGNNHLFGDAYLTPDEAKAVEFYLKGCAAGYANACSNVGWVYDLGKQTPKNRSKASGYYQKACSGGFAWGCQSLGVLYQRGDGVAKDGKKAAELFKKACDANHKDTAYACVLLSDAYAAGMGVPKDSTQAILTLAKACELGYKDRCPADVAAKPAASGCSVAKVQLGTDTYASVERDIKRRGGEASSGGTNNGKPTLSAMSGDYSDVSGKVMAVNYTFDGAGASGKLFGVMIVIHANSNDDFAKMLAERKAATEAAAKNAHCAVRLAPDANTFFIREFYEPK